MGSNAVDIVISTYKRGSRILPTINSIRASSHPHFTLWILDQSEDCQTEEAVAPILANDQRLRYLRMPLRGISATRNAGAALGTAPYILFTNDDCVVAKRWVEAMVCELRNPKNCLAFGRVLAGPLQSTDLPFSIGSQMVLALKESTVREVYRHDRFNLGFGHGHNMGARRDAFSRLGGFDEKLGAGTPFASWDDLDIGYRILRRGGQLVYTPEALLYHCHWLNWQGVQASYRNYGIGAGAAAAKYIRSGDPEARKILVRWFFDHGLRQILSGMFKRRSLDRIRVGFSQLYYPWLGIAASLPYAIDRRTTVYTAVRSNTGKYLLSTILRLVPLFKLLSLK